jgi:hypothetical protein
MKNEIWKSIPKTCGRYEISNMGRIRSYLKQGRRRFYVANIPQRFIHLSEDKNGYSICRLWYPGGPKSVKVHQIVLNVFVGPKPQGFECRHLNDIKSDNRKDNLKWGTRYENQVIDGGGRKIIGKGEQNPAAILKEKTVRNIKHTHKIYPQATHQEIADLYGLGRRNVSRIISGERWKHVSI